MFKLRVPKSQFQIALRWILIIHLQCVQSQIAFYFPIVESMFEIVNDMPASQCRDDLQKYVTDIGMHKEWALKMFDASVKFPVGLVNGESYQMGNFDQCIQTQTIFQREIAGNDTSINLQNETIYGKYCLIEITKNPSADNQSETKNWDVSKCLHKNSWVLRNQINSIYWALCVPSSCNTSETITYFRSLFRESLPESEMQLSLPPSSCYSQIDKLEQSFTVGQTLFCVALFAYLLFVISATSYDIFQQCKWYFGTGYIMNEAEKDTLIHNVIVAFSLMKNVKNIFETRTKHSDLKLDCIHGLRCISMYFILAGHAIVFLIGSPIINKTFWDNAMQQVQNTVYTNHSLHVDTFLILSGFLLCYLLLMELDKTDGRLNFLQLYLMRFLRLTPSYLVILMFYCTMLPLLGSGPFWKNRIQEEHDRCIVSWWSNLLYINNYVNTNNICMFQSWYLAVDTQLFLISPAIIYTLWHKKVVGEVLLATTCLIAIILPLVFTTTNNLDPILMIYSTEVKDLSKNYFYKNYYIKTHMRAIPYIVGLVCGYIVYRMKSDRIPFVIRILFGTLAVIAGVCSMCSVVMFYQPDYEYEASVAGFYTIINRLAWAIAIGWTVIVCVTTNSYVDNFLSCKIWAAFSRISYSAYLVNGLVELFSYGTTRTPRYMSYFNTAIETSGHIVVTLILAFIVCVLFESPIPNLEKLAMGKNKPDLTHSVFSDGNETIGENETINENDTLSSFSGLPDLGIMPTLHTIDYNDDSMTGSFDSQNNVTL